MSKCQGCGGTGVRPYAAAVVQVPDGWVVVERCDSCMRFGTDLGAAQTWGAEAHWVRSSGHAQAVCRVRPVAGLAELLERAKGSPMHKRWLADAAEAAGWPTMSGVGPGEWLAEHGTLDTINEARPG